MLLCDNTIRKYCTSPAWMPWGKPMIEPFSEAVEGDGVISYGLTSGGYDMRLGPKVLIFKSSYGQVVDPRRFSDPEYCRKMFDDISVCDPGGNAACLRCHGEKGGCEKGSIVFPPKSYVLAYSLEYFRIPRHLKGRCVGKSTYARLGVIVNTTPLEPEWEGNLTIELYNSNPNPVLLFPTQGIAQLEFELLDAEPKVSYKDKKGKYDKQGAAPVPAIVK